MSYGLFDADLDVYPYIPFFNLELMKLSTYYKNKREIVTLSPSFAPNMYQNFILRQDFQYTNYPIMDRNNITYGGRAFNTMRYVPLPIEIEQCKPDTSLYNRVENKYIISKQRESAFRRMRKAEHLRISLDGKTVWKDYEKQLRFSTPYCGVIFHDYDLNAIESGRECVADILSHFKPFKDGQRIGMKFPIQIYNGEDLLSWCSIKPMLHFYSIQYNGFIDNDVLKELIEITRHTSSMIQMNYNISACTSYEDFITHGIIELFHQICFLRTQGIVFSLIYDENFFIDPRWIKVIKLISSYWSSILSLPKKDYERILPYDSMYSFVSSFESIHWNNNWFSIDEVRELFQFVRVNNYELFKDFYEYRVQVGG